MTKGWLIQAGELCTCPGTIRNQTNPYRLALLWNTRSMWSYMGKRWHTQPDQQFVCHSTALGHWPEPAGALVGRAGPTLATAAPSPWHLQSPLFSQRGHCCAWAHTALRSRATPQAHVPPGNPLHCRSPSLVPLTAMTFSSFSHVSHRFQGPPEHGSALSTAHHSACTPTTKLSSLHYSQFIYTPLNSLL